MKVDNLTPVLTAAPGERATCRLRIENTESTPLRYRLRVIGFDDAQVLRPPPTAPLPAGAAEEVALEFVIPDAYAAGHHSVAVEVVSDRPGVAPAIAAITVTVGTIDDVAIAVVPSTIRAHRRASFRVDIDNRSARPIDLDLAGEGPDLTVRLRPDRLVLRPGERVRTTGRVKGPRHLFGEALQHSMTVTARSDSAPSYAPATFQQRPMFPRGLRSLLAVLLVVGIWAGAVGAAFLWWDSRQDEAEDPPAELVDTDGDGQPDTPADQKIDTNGDGEPDTLAADVAEQVAAAAELGEPQEGGSDRPTRTVVGGTVKAGETGNDEDVVITLAALDLGEVEDTTGAEPAALTGSAGQGRGIKLWPARFGRYEPAGTPRVRQTLSVESVASGPDGAWRFADVPIGQHYRLSFAREGFDTQAFVVTPTADGEPIDMEVALEPSSGAVSGVVVGPGGPLANVELVMTDGTLTFHTSSASGSGAFLITGVSTPGTYTLTANLRGHGTEVIQVRLDPGEVRTGLRIGMTPGVGSITGRITEGGEPLGGVTLTASIGDDTRSTTSLTEGDRGLYTFPQLAIPGRYTVTASLDGYVTQSRVVTLAGNETGVDFAMVKTTGAITGIVASSNGGPLTGANIRVSRDELFFDTNSAVTPQPGSFTITDLPPGTYLIEFSRFDHEASSQVVTVASGQVLDLGQIVLQFRERPGIPETGSLEVSVIDSENTPLVGAEVRLVDVATGQVVAMLSDEGINAQSTFVFDPLPIGTYRLEAIKRPDYRLRTQRLSIGLGRETAVVQLFKLGQVAGRILDSRTLAELDDYAVQIFRITPGQPDVPVGPEISVPAGSPPNIGPNDDMVGWESPPNAALTTGTYRIAIVDRPPGYRVLDQVILDGYPAMQFEVRADSDAPIMFNDLLADLNPSLTGQIVVPRRDPVTGATTFAPVNDDDLAVSLRCGTRSLALDPADPDQLFSADGNPALDSYRFSAILIEENGLNGTCELTVSVQDPPFAEGEYITATKPLPSPLLPASPTVTGALDKVVDVALVAERDIAGHAFWTDIGADPPLGEPVDATGVDVRTVGAVVLGFDPRDDGADPTPNTIVTELRTTTDADGRWVYDPPKQVFGTTTYEFSSPLLYETRSFPLTVSETGRSVPTPAPDGLELADGAGGVSVELDALGGDITADVTIRTIKGAPDVSSFEWEVTNGVTAFPATTVQQPTPREWRATVETADPGTYTGSLAFDTDRYVPFEPFDPAAIPIPFQNPGEDLPPIELQLVELADLRVQVTDPDPPTPVVSANITVAHEQAGPGDPPDSTTPSTPTVGGVVDFNGLAVNSEAPESTPVTYRVTPVAAGYDLDRGEYTITSETGPPETFSCTLPGTPAASLPGCPVDVDLRAGGQRQVTFSLQRFGTISGNVMGDTDGDGVGTEPLRLDGTPPVEITAMRIAGPDGVVLPEDEWVEGVVTQSGGGFTVAGEPGLYTIDVSHDEYEPLTAAGTPATRTEVVDQAGVSHFVWRMTNAADNPAGTWTLEIAKGSLDINAREDTTTGTAISGATILLRGPGPAGPVIPVEPTGADGRSVVDGLFPGTYTLEIRRTTAGEDEFFPVIATVDVPRGVDPTARTRIVRAPLPRIGGWVAGLIVAQNTLDRPVPVPAVTITRSYDPPAVESENQGTVETVPNQATEAQIVPPAQQPATTLTIAASPTGTPVRYEFENLATGRHELSFSSAASEGYDVTPGAQPVDVTDTDPPSPATEVNAVDAVYTAANRTVLVTVQTAGPTPVPITDATVTLTGPAPGSTPVTGTHTTGGVYEFTGVAPDLEAYTATASKPLHTTTSIDVVVPVGVGAFTAPDPIELPATFAEVTGIARKRQNPAQTPPLPPLTGLDGGFARLIHRSSGAEVASGPTDGEGRYRFAVAAADVQPGPYEVRVEAPNFASRVSGTVIPRTGASVTVPDIVVPALATLNITVNGPAPDAISASIIAPASHTGVAATRSGNVFTFRVDPGGDGLPAISSFQVRLTAPTFAARVETFSPAPGPGAVVNRTVPLEPRVLSGPLSGNTTGVQVRARAAVGTATVAGTVSGTTYTIPGVDAGSWIVEVGAIGVGRGVSSTPVGIAATDGNVTGPTVTVAARQVAITFAATPANTNVAITGGTSGPANGPPLTQPETDTTIDWTASLDGWVSQSGSAPLQISQTDPFAASLSRTDAIPITLARPVVTATVAPVTGPDPVIDAAVYACPGTGTTCGATTTGAIVMPFNATDGVYRAETNASGPWRVGASRGTDVADVVPFTVSTTDGSISPAPPFALTLEAPPGP